MKLATKVVSGEPILNNDTQSPAEKSNVWRLKKLMKIFWVRKFYHENEKEREILKTLLWIFTFIYNAAIDFLYIIPYYSQQIQKLFSMVQHNFLKEWKSLSSSRTKLFVPVVSPYTLCCVLYFDLTILAALC